MIPAHHLVSCSSLSTSLSNPCTSTGRTIIGLLFVSASSDPATRSMSRFDLSVASEWCFEKWLIFTKHNIFVVSFFGLLVRNPHLQFNIVASYPCSISSAPQYPATAPQHLFTPVVTGVLQESNSPSPCLEVVSLLRSPHIAQAQNLPNTLLTRFTISSPRSMSLVQSFIDTGFGFS